jgi:branched-subunit amino acid aminotransferase/4-amino-4-deoxychorismate lyase
MQVYLNGQYPDAAEARVSIWDGGYLYGDGVTTTLRLYRGQPLDLAAHLDRLRRHAAALALPMPLDAATAAAAIDRLTEANDLRTRDGRLRITISRGGDPDDPLPLRDLERLRSTVLMTLAAVPEELAIWARDGIAVCLLEPGSARGNLPHLKTLNSLPALLAQRQAAARGCREAILLGEDGQLLEGSLSNLFLVTGGRLQTPARAGGLLPGLTRERILALAAGLGIDCDQRRLEPTDLLAADEAFTASSVREVLPIVAVDGRPLGAGRPGPVTRALQGAYRELVKKALPAAGPPAV